MPRHGTLPANELFEELRPLSRNDGVLDLDALLANPTRPQPDDGTVGGKEGPSFLLYRVGDAVSSRNIHAAIILFDSLRLCKNF